MAIVMKGSVAQRVNQVIDDAVELARLGDQKFSAAKMAERLYDAEHALMVEASPAWVIERLTWMIQRRRQARWDETHPSQMVLSDPIFQGLPKAIYLRNGKRPALLDCNSTQTLDHLQLLRMRNAHAPEITQFEALCKIHSKWSATRRGISWRDAQALEAQEREQLGQ